jgi:hypothetical protein
VMAERRRPDAGDWNLLADSSLSHVLHARQRGRRALAGKYPQSSTAPRLPSAAMGAGQVQSPAADSSGHRCVPFPAASRCICDASGHVTLAGGSTWIRQARGQPLRRARPSDATRTHKLAPHRRQPRAAGEHGSIFLTGAASNARSCRKGCVASSNAYAFIGMVTCRLRHRRVAPQTA